jgi:dihydrofolate reductase
MGRKTWESLGRPLPGRQNIVVTRNRDYRAAGATVVASIGDGLAAAGDADEVFLIGGAELYTQALPLADCLCLTEVALTPDGDAHFPDFDRGLWQETARAAHVAANGIEYAFVRYERR